MLFLMLIDDASNFKSEASFFGNIAVILNYSISHYKILFKPKHYIISIVYYKCYIFIDSINYF